MKKPFDRIVTVMFENQYRNYVISHPFLKKLAAAGADMTNYFGSFHPSQTNYIASLAGEICNVTNDTPPASPLMQETLVDLLEAKNVSWKAYMEGYPGDPWNKKWEDPKYNEQYQPLVEYPPAGGADLTRYYRKHNAFASFHTIQKDKSRWEKIVGDAEFWEDIANNSLPEYSWFTPDIWNDGHYLYNTHIDTEPRTKLVTQVATWLEYVFLGNIETKKIQGGLNTGLDNIGFNLDIDLLLTDPKKAWEQSNVPPRTLLVVTFDEADYDAQGYDTAYDGQNQVYTVLLGDMIEPGQVISTPYNHYNLIRTVEENYGLGSLNKNDLNANWFRFLWKVKFSWSTPISSKLTSCKTLAVTSSAEPHLVYSDSNGQLYESFLSSDGWSSPQAIGLETTGGIGMTTIGNIDFLVYEGFDGELIVVKYDNVNQNWSEAYTSEQKTSGSFAVTAYLDISQNIQKLMLCWVDENGFIQSMNGDGHGNFNDPVPVNQLTDGPMTLGQVGASLFLAYKERNTRKMRMTSYNVGKFNAFKAVDFQDNPAIENYTTIYEWSPTDYQVAHFSKKMNALANAYQNLGGMTMATISGEMHLIHRGGYADMSNAYTEIFGLTGICTASSQLTNGYGTLNQAGWTVEEKLAQVNIAVDAPIAVCSDNETLTLVWFDSTSKTVKSMQGAYEIDG